MFGGNNMRVRKRRLLIKKRLIARRKSCAGIKLFSGVIQTGRGVEE
jgi:hypothetical protein